MAKSKVVIFGSTGFLGRHLYENFLSDGRYEVHGFSPANIDLTSSDSVVKLCGMLDRNAVIIMAASALAKDKSFSSFQKEIAMFLNLANPYFLSRMKHFILVSSTAIYGHHSTSSIVESSPAQPDDLYSLAKYIGEIIFQRACADHKVGLTIVRPGILYGLGDARSPLYRFITGVRSGQPIEIHGDDSTRLVWLHIHDAWRAIQNIVENHKTGDYNIISDGNGTSLVELAEMVFKTYGKRTGVKRTSSSKISPDMRFNLSKFKTNFPGFEFARLVDGMKDYVIS